ncbi:hypothetical protein [Thauera sp.]|uniref:hypothetical protein n=1 Tax=Thauera sp. TaxID=1905334 RepID=UPI002601B56F|nr:hypothetical protein [Thauera sp.]
MPPKHDFEDDELVGLSDDERAALEDDEADAAPPTGEDDEDADGDDEQDDEASTGEDDEDDEGEGDEVDAAGAEGDADPGVTPPAAPREEAPSEFQPQFTAAVPEDLAARLEGVSQRFGELQQKLEDGEISVADYVVQNQALVDERMALKLAEEQAKWAANQNAAQREQRWKWEVERFYAGESAAIYKDPILKAALDVAVRQLDADPANAKRSDAWILEEADRQVRERMNLGSTQRQSRDRKGGKQPNLSNLPKTLANLPAAELSETGADEFAYLEKLADKDPMAYEAALRKLTPEQEARYLGVA